MKIDEPKGTKDLRDGRNAGILHVHASSMSSTGAITLFLWVVAPCVQAFLATRMFRLRLRREFPLFFIYLIYSMVAEVGLLAIYEYSSPPYVIYFSANWASEVVELALSVLVIYEIYRRVFDRYEALRSLCDVLFQWAAAILVLIGVLAVASAQGPDHDRLMSGILMVSQSAALLKTGLLLFLFLFARVFGLTWRHYALGIALGFGLFTSVELVGIALRNHLGMEAARLYNYLNSGAYNCGVLIWCCYFLSAEQAERRLVPPPSASVAELEGWNDTLRGFLRQ